jgi:hypothetical protein
VPDEQHRYNQGDRYTWREEAIMQPTRELIDSVFRDKVRSVFDAVDASLYDPAECVIEWIPRPDDVILGGASIFQSSNLPVESP